MPYKGNYKVKKPKETSKLEKEKANDFTSKPSKFYYETTRTKGGLNLRARKQSTSKEMHNKEYPFYDSNISGLFDELLKADLIMLPKPKRPGKANRSIDRNHCKYHRVLGHSIEKYFTFKEKVIDLARQRAILLEEDKVSNNHVALTIVRPTDSKVLEEFQDSKIEPGKPYVGYPSNSDKNNFGEA
ncbi:hypothetical protein LIER_16152 [Lithospermum erythrorhizon]|uniref:Uncharacterized protein n=1 Tax=Lithospermum erythrorhizon TaxID=34254 RepID=A0AAV3Q5L8_LITER